jgi:hypothetical protein
MAIQNSILTSSVAANVYAATVNSAITTIHLCNFSTGTVSVNVYAVTGSGVVAGTNNILYSNLSITSYNTYVIYAEKFILNAGDSIRANASAGSSVSAVVSSIGI